MQKHLITAKSNERATQISRPSGNQWPKADGLVLGKEQGTADTQNFSVRVHPPVR
jgi:hypothetical protein